MLFQTRRLYVRELEPSDLPEFYDMQRNPNVMRYIKAPMILLEAERELDRFISYYRDSSTFYRLWAVIRVADATFLGMCGVYRNQRTEYEVAYRLRERYWGQGLGSKIGAGLIDYLFTSTQLEALTAYAHEHNTGSIAILERLMTFSELVELDSLQGHERKYTLRRSE